MRWRVSPSHRRDLKLPHGEDVGRQPGKPTCDSRDYPHSAVLRTFLSGVYDMGAGGEDVAAAVGAGARLPPLQPPIPPLAMSRRPQRKQAQRRRLVAGDGDGDEVVVVAGRRLLARSAIQRLLRRRIVPVWMWTLSPLMSNGTKASTVSHCRVDRHLSVCILRIDVCFCSITDGGV